MWHLLHYCLSWKRTLSRLPCSSVYSVSCSYLLSLVSSVLLPCPGPSLLLASCPSLSPRFPASSSSGAGASKIYLFILQLELYTGWQDHEDGDRSQTTRITQWTKQWADKQSQIRSFGVCCHCRERGRAERQNCGWFKRNLAIYSSHV